MYSLWLMPNEVASKTYQDIIYKLSKPLAAPIFEPHITLLSGMDTPILDQTFYELSVLAALTKPFNVSFSNIAYENDFYRSLYMKAHPVDKLIQLQKETKDIFKTVDYPFRPHLSLLYAELAQKCKPKLAKQLNTKLLKKAQFSSIRLMQTKGKVEDWKLVEEFPFWLSEIK